MWIGLVLLLCFVLISHADINCRTTAWWILQPFSKTILQTFLSTSKEPLLFNSSNPLAKFMNIDQHPVYFEFNQQNQCEESSLPPFLANITEQTFVEFKLQIPYLIRNDKTVMLKPLIYQNSLLNVDATHLVYGLPAYFAKMTADFDQNRYSISYEQGSIETSFVPLMPKLIPFGSALTANFSSFIDANYSPWLAYPPLSFLHPTKCASNIYNISQTALIRPVNVTLNIHGDILGQIPPGIYTNFGNQPVGAWQIDVQTKITSPFECP